MKYILMTDHSLSILANSSVDITGSQYLQDVTVEIDDKRGVLYVHVNGITVLRICRIPKLVIVERITL